MTSRKHQEEDVICFLQKLNNDIKEFVRNSVESSMSFKKWSALSKDLKPFKCWEIKGCTKKDCPAYGNIDCRCWLQVGTLCGGKVQGEFAKKYTTCFECDVMRLISQEPVMALYENINTLIFHLNDKTVKLGELSIRDQLTNLYNRHFFNEIIEKESSRAERRNEPLSFIMIDIDNFKEINDTLGHLTGDKILAQAANLLTNTVRKADIVFRFGGDEFLIVLANADYDMAKGMAQRIMDSVERWNRDRGDSVGCRLSFSIGCSTYEKSRDMLKTLKEADARMYQNKKDKKHAENS